MRRAQLRVIEGKKKYIPIKRNLNRLRENEVAYKDFTHKQKCSFCVFLLKKGGSYRVSKKMPILFES